MRDVHPVGRLPTGSRRPRGGRRGMCRGARPPSSGGWPATNMPGSLLAGERERPAQGRSSSGRPCPPSARGGGRPAEPVPGGPRGLGVGAVGDQSHGHEDRAEREELPGMPPREWSTNWGRTAARNTTDLGLLTPTMKPSRTMRVAARAARRRSARPRRRGCGSPAHRDRRGRRRPRLDHREDDHRLGHQHADRRAPPPPRSAAARGCCRGRSAAGPAAEGQGPADDEQHGRAGDQGQQDRREPEGRAPARGSARGRACQTWVPIERADSVGHRHGQQAAARRCGRRPGRGSLGQLGAGPAGQGEGDGDRRPRSPGPAATATTNVMVSSGSSAPRMNATIEANAAVHGLEMSLGSIPSSASACAPGRRGR